MCKYKILYVILFILLLHARILHIRNIWSWTINKYNYATPIHVNMFFLSYTLTFEYEYILHYITLHYITLHYITLHYITLHYITLHYITLHYITLHYITLHYITLHYITLHYITLYQLLYLLFKYVSGVS